MNITDSKRPSVGVVTGSVVRTSAEIEQLEEMAAKLLDSANKLPAGPLSRGVLEEIGKFGARITALKAKADERIPQAKAVSGSA
jgi:hypothetical protein